ncbi:nucleotidyl transferase AbiEii/AbiGii toxin family protein [Fodinibius sediminis]|uniref:Predicted nucleotidyltransferase component of viral defense system n=1 Tax=Fodinibius sediminis TaxID=1214077 RepID=A0A521AU13_9BACT|nr:nucleotidyl transferase AbiEii/AbiGii toxin family protein [Fodinibius sediminis]SMO38332.1 Predicted nucleotidyltransferase component of viral defense system [Fodinibius sediminis]
MIERYRNQVRLLLSVLPIIADIDFFALKGGTAINFFWRDFPRLSVDIDLAYLPIKGRDESLQEIKNGVRTIAEEVSVHLPESTITTHKSGGTLSKLIIRDTDAQIKVEVNTVLRGTLFDPVEREVKPKIQDGFELFAAIQTLSLEDLYGGKICAALDRQHPRDLYDVKLLFENEGITEQVRTAFIGYLISHSRPIHELLNPNPIELEGTYRKEFEGMTNELVPLEKLIEVQDELPELLLEELTEKERAFLISFQQADPQWDSIPISHLKELPGVRWKLINIKKMDKRKHQEMGEKLEGVLTRNN